jgi:hypothetical protein
VKNIDLGYILYHIVSPIVNTLLLGLAIPYLFNTIVLPILGMERGGGGGMGGEEGGRGGDEEERKIEFGYILYHIVSDSQHLVAGFGNSLFVQFYRVAYFRYGTGGGGRRRERRRGKEERAWLLCTT